MITTITDNLEVTLDEAKAWLRLYVEDLEENGNENNDPDIADIELEMLIEAAKQKADNYVQRDEEYFEDGNGVEIPKAIKLWCLKDIARQYERRASGEDQRSINGAESVHWGEEDYEELWPYRNLSRPPLVEED